MSLLPVSDAIRQLEDEGLVESRPRVGTRMRIPLDGDVRDRYIMREALETQAAWLSVEKANVDERSELRGVASHVDAMALAAYDGRADSDVLFRIQPYHPALHTRVAERSGCAALCEALEKNQVLIFNGLYDTAAHHRMLPGSHAELAEALCGTDIDATEAAMRRHVRFGLEEIQAEIAARFVPVTAPLSALQEGRVSRRLPDRPAAWRGRSSGG